MGYVAKWLSDQIQTKVADQVVEETLSDLKRREKVLDDYVPFETYSSRNFLAYVFDEKSPIASIIPYGSEPPTTQTGTFRKINAQLLKSGLSYVYDEEKQWEMKEAMERAEAARMPIMDIRDPNTGELIRGTNNDLAKFLYGTIEKIAAAQIEVLNVLTWKGLQYGQIDYTDPRSGEKVSLDYKNPYDTTYNHFPSALAGNDRWDQYATANGLSVLREAINTFIDTNGFRPDAIAMSRRLREDLVSQQSTKDAAVARVGTQVGTVGYDMLGDILMKMDLPPIVTFDEQFQSEYDTKQVYRGRFLDDNRFVFLTKDMGKRAMGPTIEADGAEGVYVVTREVNKMPSVDATQAVATILPAFVNPKLLYAQQVKDAA